MRKTLTEHGARKTGTDTTGGRGASETSRRLSDGGHGSGQEAASGDFLSHSGVLIEPLDDLRGPADGPTAAVSHDDSGLTDMAASILGQRGRPDGGPRGAAVLQAVTVYLRQNARRQGQKRGRHSTGIARKRASAIERTPAWGLEHGPTDYQSLDGGKRVSDD